VSAIGRERKVARVRQDAGWARPKRKAEEKKWAVRGEKRAWVRCRATEENKARPECWAETEEERNVAESPSLARF
jgi:hypothetical protein